MSNFNFFDWMRSGVRDAVLLGVSDAVEEIGMPAESESGNNDALAFLRDTKTKQIGGGSTGTKSTAGRKRLGRSLKEIEAATGKK